MNKSKGSKQYFNHRIREISHSMREMGIGKRIRKKPREEDRRRKYDNFSDSDFLRRYRELNCNKSALARELSISRQAVAKRLRRVNKEARESAMHTLGLLQHVFGDRK